MQTRKSTGLPTNKKPTGVPKKSKFKQFWLNLWEKLKKSGKTLTDATKEKLMNETKNLIG